MLVFCYFYYYSFIINMNISTIIYLYQHNIIKNDYLVKKSVSTKIKSDNGNT